MAGNSADVIFKRGQDALEDEQDNMWDDTALIDAYDRATSMTYDAINTKDRGKSLKKQSLKVSAVKRRRGVKNTQKTWNEQDKCIARYSEDQVWYEATIISIDRSRNTCIVRYDEYENEEEQNLAFLKRIADDVENDDETVETDTTEDEQFADVSESALDEANTAGGGGGEAISGYIPAMSNGMHHKHNMVPNLPPPPPLAGDSREQHALSSMLMSWYMSGYHTGYYQAVRDLTKGSGKKSNAKNQ